MKYTIIFLLVLLIIYVISECFNKETFSESEEGMLIFNRLNNSLIKKYKIGSFTSINEVDFKQLFRQDNVIRIIVPSAHSVRIIYKEKGTDNYSKTIDLPEGSHDLSKFTDDDEIAQIDASNEILDKNEIDQSTIEQDENLSKKVYVTNSENEILYISSNLDYLNWDWIYGYYGLGDYYINYPWGRSIYYYRNYPRWYRYRPSHLIRHWGPRRILGTNYWVRSRSDYYDSYNVDRRTAQRAADSAADRAEKRADERAAKRANAKAKRESDRDAKREINKDQNKNIAPVAKDNAPKISKPTDKQQIVPKTTKPTEKQVAKTTHASKTSKPGDKQAVVRPVAKQAVVRPVSRQSSKSHSPRLDDNEIRRKRR